MMALANRVHAPAREARRIVRDGLLGKVYAVEVHLVADQTRLKREAYRKEWYCIKARGGGGNLIWLGIHWLDLALFITGLKVKQTAGFAGVVGGQPLDVEDSAAVALRFDNGTFGTMTAGYYLDKGYQSHIQIWGEHGWLRLASIEDVADGMVQHEGNEGAEGAALRLRQRRAKLHAVRPRLRAPAPAWSRRPSPARRGCTSCKRSSPSTRPPRPDELSQSRTSTPKSLTQRRKERKERKEGSNQFSSLVFLCALFAFA